MRRLQPLQLRAWALPLLVAILIVPPIAGFALVGPPLGLALGAIEVGVVLALAAAIRFDEEIEVSGGDGGRYRVLLVLTAPLDDSERARELARIAARGAALLARTARPPEVLALAPARGARLAAWTSDLAAARLDAQSRLALSLGTLAAAGIEARGQVGDADVVQAVEDALRTFPAGEVVFASAAGEAGAIAEVRRRLDRPVTVLGRAG